MSGVDYSVSYMEGPSVSGRATSLFVKDGSTVLTIGRGHAPLVSVLSKGKLSVHLESGETVSYAFQEGFLNCVQDRVSVTILR